MQSGSAHLASLSTHGPHVPVNDKTHAPLIRSHPLCISSVVVVGQTEAIDLSWHSLNQISRSERNKDRISRSPIFHEGASKEIVVAGVVRIGDATPVGVHILCDTGSMLWAAAPLSFFPPSSLVKAKHQIDITHVGGERVKGGEYGAYSTLGLPVELRNGKDIIVDCEKVFIYAVDVSGGLIVGYPLLKAFGLLVDFVRDKLLDSLDTS